MTDHILPPLDITMPSDFNVDAHFSIHSRITSLSGFDPDTVKQFQGAWKAIVYRFKSCAEHDEAFTTSIQTHGNSPPPPDRYIQERELFGFFITGQAVIESFGYGLFAIAALIQPIDFPILTDKEQRKINLKNTSEEFEKHFSGDDITIALEKLLREDTYTEWQNIRNILIHRVHPGRLIRLSNHPPDPPVTWKVMDIEVDASTTSVRRKWLAETLNDLLQKTDRFTEKHF